MEDRFSTNAKVAALHEGFCKGGGGGGGGGGEIHPSYYKVGISFQNGGGGGCRRGMCPLKHKA